MILTSGTRVTSKNTGRTGITTSDEYILPENSGYQTSDFISAVDVTWDDGRGPRNVYVVMLTTLMS